MTTIQAQGPLRGTLRVPGDKSISHRALLFAAAARGTSTITGLSDGQDVARTRAAVVALGATVEATDSGLLVHGGDLHEAEDVLDMGNSGTGMRLIAGWLSGLPFFSVLTGDASLRSRPMARVADPLRAMGANIDTRAGGCAPVVIRGGSLRGITYTSPVASAQVKSALLLAGLNADGPTVVREPALSRAHTEELFALAGHSVKTTEHRDGSATHSLEPGSLEPFGLDIPGDPSQAAFWMVAAATVPGSDVTIENVYVGPGRGGAVDVLLRMGADIEITHSSATTADFRIRASKLSAVDIGGDDIPALIDELPVLAVAAAHAEGTTTVTGAAELRVKESDRVDTTVAVLDTLGATITPLDDGFIVKGHPEFTFIGGTVQAHLDHRIAMTAAVAALTAAAPVTVTGWDSVATSYPTFEHDLMQLRSPS